MAVPKPSKGDVKPSNSSGTDQYKSATSGSTNFGNNPKAKGK